VDPGTRHGCWRKKSHMKAVTSKGVDPGSRLSVCGSVASNAEDPAHTSNCLIKVLLGGSVETGDTSIP
jgi:hypothetical protein